MKDEKYINKKTVNKVYDLLTEKLKEIEEECNISFNIDKFKYSMKTIDMTINGFAILTEDYEEAKHLLSGKHQVSAYDKEKWKLYCKRFNLSEELVGNEINFYGERAYICGLKEKNTKYPIIIATIKGDKRYKISLQQLKNSME